MSRVCVILFFALGCGASPDPETARRPGPAAVCVLRHAEAFKNLVPRPPNLSAEALDSLTPAGEAQARETGRSLPRGVVLLWASPTKRTRQTAALLGLEVEAQVEKDLRGIEGDLSFAERRERAEANEDPRPEGGESLADARERARRLLHRVRGSLSPGERAVLVTHADLGSILVGELRQTPLLERPRHDVLATGQAICVELGPPD